MSPPTPITMEPGRIVGSYKVVRLIGAGGMAEVFAAEHVRLGRRVALKVLKPHYASKPEAIRSFFDEARLVSSLDNPHIVQVTDLIVEPGLAVCVMELLEGKTLAEEMEAQGVFDTPDALKIAHDVADALAAAHKAGVVHRDIKPDNIFLAQDRPGHRTVKLLDFGVAHLMDDSASIGGASLSGHQAGTPAYMSPEQIQGQPVKPSSDVYSMGVVTYQMLTGKLPFTANSFAEYLYKHAHEEPLPPHKAVDPPRVISKHCSMMIMGCLAKDPEKRIQDGESLRIAIERAARSAGMLIHTGMQPALVRTRPRLGHLLWLVLILLGLAGAGIWAGSHLFSTSRHPRPAPAIAEPANPSDTRSSPARPPRTDATGNPRGPGVPGGLPSSRATAQSRSLRILSDPPGAEVMQTLPRVRPLGITPLTLQIPADVSTWVLQIKAEGYQPSKVEITAKTPSPLRIVLEPSKPTPRRRSSSPARPRRRPRRRHGRPRRPRHGPDSLGTVNPFDSK